METLLLIAGMAAFLLLIMLFTRPRPEEQKPVARWKDPQVQAVFDRSRVPATRQPQPVLPSERHWEVRVLSQLRGDRAAMERLLAGQARRMPRASRTELLERVYHDHVRDQR